MGFWRVTWRVGILTVALLGCGGPRITTDRPDDVVWSSEHFDYSTRTGETAACAAVVDTLEQHRAAVLAYLGLPQLTDRISYWKYLDFADLRASRACPPNAEACASPSAVRAAEVLYEHELIHAYLGEWGSPPHLFGEGIAEALACQAGYAIKPEPADWRGLGQDSPQDFYTYGRWFVGYLLHAFGPEPFVRLYKGEWARDDDDAVASRFLAAYGRSLDELWHEAFAAPPRSPICVPIWECASPALALDAEGSESRERCDGGGKYRTITVTDPALLVMENASFVAVKACDGGGPNLELVESSGDLVAELRPGTTFVSRWRAAGPIRATLAPPLAVDDTCAAVPFRAVTLPNEIRYWTFAARSGDTARVVSLPAQLQGSFMEYVPLNPDDAARPEVQGIDLCGDCAAQDCVPLPTSWTTLSAAAVRIQPGGARPDGYRYAPLMFAR
jgi:hypothetical protein